MTKPTEAPEVAEPEQQVPVPEASDNQPEEPATDTPPEIPDLSHDHPDANPFLTESSNPHKPPEEHGEDVIINEPASENQDVQPSWPSTPLKTSSLRGKNEI